MIVYIPTYTYDYEGGDYLGVYTTFEKAYQVLVDEDRCADRFSIDAWDTETGKYLPKQSKQYGKNLRE